MLRKYSAKHIKANSELTERQWRIYHFLHANPVGVLSSVTPDDTPHGTVIYFSIDSHFTIYFITKDRTRKHDNLKHNSHVMLTVFESVSQTTAQIVGVATELTDTRTISRIAGAVVSACTRTSDAGLPPISKLQAGMYVGYKITPAQIRIATYSQANPGDFESLFDSIESFELQPPI
jgi:uncharacterized protein YhbP (UPF0306 family)